MVLSNLFSGNPYLDNGSQYRHEWLHFFLSTGTSLDTHLDRGTR